MSTVYEKSKLEAAIDTMLDEFFKYSNKFPDDKFKLNFEELKCLIQTELRSSVENCWNSGRIKQIMDDLDKNKDGKVSFEEFVFLMGQVATFRNPAFKDYTPCICSCGQYINGRFQ